MATKAATTAVAVSIQVEEEEDKIEMDSVEKGRKEEEDKKPVSAGSDNNRKVSKRYVGLVPRLSPQKLKRTWGRG